MHGTASSLPAVSPRSRCLPGLRPPPWRRFDASRSPRQPTRSRNAAPGLPEATPGGAGPSAAIPARRIASHPPVLERPGRSPSRHKPLAINEIGPGSRGDPAVGRRSRAMSSASAPSSEGEAMSRQFAAFLVACGHTADGVELWSRVLGGPASGRCRNHSRPLEPLQGPEIGPILDPGG